MRITLRTVALPGLLLAGSCIHHEYRTDFCSSQDRPSRSAIAWQRTSQSNVISGRVVDLQTRSIGDAEVRLADATARAITRADGLFQFMNVKPGAFDACSADIVQVRRAWWKFW